MTPAAAIAKKALSIYRGAAGPLACLYALDWAFTLGIGLLAAWRFGHALSQHPAVDLFGWTALFMQRMELVVELAIVLGGAILAYLVCSSALFAALLAQLFGSHCLWRRALVRTASHLLVLRMMVALAQVLTATGWLLTAFGVYRVALTWADERYLLAAELAVAMPFSALLALLALLSHFALPLVVYRGIGAWQGLRQTMAQFRRQPATLAVLWLLYLGWVASASAAAIGAQEALQVGWIVAAATQLALVLKGLGRLWAWACALHATEGAL